MLEGSTIGLGKNHAIARFGVSRVFQVGRYDIIVSELMDASGLGESLLSVLEHACRDLASPGAQVGGVMDSMDAMDPRTLASWILGEDGEERYPEFLKTQMMNLTEDLCLERF